MKISIATVLLTATLGLGIASSALAGETFHQVKDERGVIGHVRGDGLTEEPADKATNKKVVVRSKSSENASSRKIGFDWRRAPAAERAYMNELYHGEGPKW